MRLFPITKAGMFKLASMLVVFGFILPLSAQAAVYKPKDISFTMDSLVNGQKTNFVRLGEDGKGVPIDLTITLNSPSKLFAGRSAIGQSGDDLDLGGVTVTTKRILGLGVGYIPQAKSDKYFCDKQSLSGVVSVDSTNYTGCVFYKYSSNVAGWRPVLSTDEYTAGQVALKGTFTVDAAVLKELGANADSGKSFALSFYPYVYTSALGQEEAAKLISTDIVTPTGVINTVGRELALAWKTANGIQISSDAPQVVYFQLYKTQAAADADAGKPAPSDVPAYASASSKLDGQDGNVGFLGLINKIIAAVLTLILQIVYAIFWFVIVPLLQSILSIRTYKDSFANVIYPGWEIIRNLCNIAFVVAMLWMGLSQIFGFDSFNYKKGLGKLVIAALLVNFSLIIPQTILAVSETVQNQFLPNNTKTINALGFKLMVEPMQKLAVGTSTVDSVSSDGFKNFGTTARIFVFFCMAIAAFFVFAAIMFNLLVRLIALWALLLTSPVGFAGGVLPFTQSFQKQWWKYFICYATYTPVVAFMLNLTVLMTDRISAGISGTSTPAFTNSVSPTISSVVFTLLPNFLLLGFMYATISVAKMACGFAPVDKLTSKFGGKALDLASTSMSGRPDKAIKEAGSYVGATQAAKWTRNELAFRASQNDWENAGGLKRTTHSLLAKGVGGTLKDAYAQTSWGKRGKDKAQYLKDVKGRNMFDPEEKQAARIVNDAIKKGKEDFEGKEADVIKDKVLENWLNGKNNLPGRSSTMAGALELIDQGKVGGLLKSLKYKTNYEGWNQFLQDGVQKKFWSASEANILATKAEKMFKKNKMHTYEGLVDDYGKIKDINNPDPVISGPLKAKIESKQAGKVSKLSGSEVHESNFIVSQDDGTGTGNMVDVITDSAAQLIADAPNNEALYKNLKNLPPHVAKAVTDAYANKGQMVNLVRDKKFNVVTTTAGVVTYVDKKDSSIVLTEDEANKMSEKYVNDAIHHVDPDAMLTTDVAVGPPSPYKADASIEASALSDRKNAAWKVATKEVNAQKSAAKLQDNLASLVASSTPEQLAASMQKQKDSDRVLYSRVDQNKLVDAAVEKAKDLGDTRPDADIRADMAANAGIVHSELSKPLDQVINEKINKAVKGMAKTITQATAANINTVLEKLDETQKGYVASHAAELKDAIKDSIAQKNPAIDTATLDRHADEMARIVTEHTNRVVSGVAHQQQELFKQAQEVQSQQLEQKLVSAFSSGGLFEGELTLPELTSVRSDLTSSMAAYQVALAASNNNPKDVQRLTDTLIDNLSASLLIAHNPGLTLPNALAKVQDNRDAEGQRMKSIIRTFISGGKKKK